MKGSTWQRSKHFFREQSRPENGRNKPTENCVKGLGAEGTESYQGRYISCDALNKNRVNPWKGGHSRTGTLKAEGLCFPAGSGALSGAASTYGEEESRGGGANSVRLGGCKRKRGKKGKKMTSKLNRGEEKNQAHHPQKNQRGVRPSFQGP